MTSKFFLFVEFLRSNSLLYPSRVTVDGLAIEPDKHMHIVFKESVVFYFTSVPETGALALVHRDACLESFLNDIVVPIIAGESSVVGSLRVKVTQGVVRERPITCREIDFTQPIFIGHRGLGANRLGATVKENTLLSFTEAMKHKGIAGIELDVMLTADKKLAIFHDLFYPVDLNGRKTILPVSSLTYSSDMCQALVEERTPLLGEVLKCLEPKTAGIVIEIKYPTNDAMRMCPGLGKYSRSELVQQVIDCVLENQAFIQERWIVISSFDPDIVWILSDALRGTGVLVVHNVWFGHENDQDHETMGHFKDIRNLEPPLALSQATLLETGLAFEADYVLRGEFGEIFADTSRPLFSYGAENLKASNIRAQKHINAFFIDDMALAQQF